MNRCIFPVRSESIIPKGSLYPLPCGRGLSSPFEPNEVNPVKNAIIKKDFKSLTRRREMASYLAVPVLIIVSMLIPSLFSTERQSISSTGGMFLVFPLTFAILLFALMNSLISVGQEGYAVWNIYVSPMSPEEFVKAKMSANIILSLLVALVLWFVLILFGHPSFRTGLAFLFISIALVFVESIIGLMMGIMFPDFRETIRSRFIRISGSLLGMFLGMVAAGFLLLPYILYIFTAMGKDLNFILASLAVFVLTAIISAISYRLCISKAGNLFGELTL